MKAIALVLCVLLAGAAAVQVQSEADETVEAQLVDAAEVDERDANEDAVDVEADDEDSAVDEAEEEGEAEEDAEDEGEAESESQADAEWWFWKKAAKKAKNCDDCTSNGHLYLYHWPTGGMMCVDKSNAEHYRWAMNTKFPKAEKQSECAGAKSSGDSTKSSHDTSKIKATTDKLEANTKAAKEWAATKGKTDFDNCPAALWKLFVKQTTLEKEYVGPTYAGGAQSALAGVEASIPEYSFEPLGKFGEVYGQYEDIKEVADLIKGGFAANDLTTMGAGLFVKLINAATAYLAKKALEATLIDNNIRAIFFDPAVDMADCLVTPGITKELSIMNWPYGNEAEITIQCPVCNHLTIPFTKLQATHATEAAAILAAAKQVSAIGKAVRANSSKFTSSNPFGKSKAGKAIITFLSAIDWMNGDKKTALDTATLKTDTDAGVTAVSFLSVHERVRKAARHTLQP